MKRRTMVSTQETASVSPPPSIKKKPAKVFVAKSDFQQALQAIDNVMDSEKHGVLPKAGNTVEQEQSAFAETDASTETDTANVKDSEDREDNVTARTDQDEERDQGQAQDENNNNNPTVAFLTDVQNSLKQRLIQVVNPIPDEDYHEKARGPFIQLKINAENEAEQRQIAREKVMIAAQDEAQRKEEQRRAKYINNDYDDHELLDRDALKRARELREQVRTMAEQRQQQQAQILLRAIELAHRQVRLIAGDILVEEQQESASGNEKDDNQQAKREADNEARRKILRQMESSLLALSESFAETVDRSLPKNLKDLRDTIVTIDKSLQKKRQPQSQSQTELAIVSRDNEGMQDGEEADLPVIVEHNQASIDGYTPESMLAVFLSKY
ncbi:expressed unknown protein [Seminavis robusta]|uniref:Uncharacterized protein n=1 Tax=Seminavis robusta TaxID=568900 RepID=A0A9N8D702_9STRA|nr:expressed unknown protein [Seminavis robusta]|eukprot:Sro17_g012250.1 n/a (384) ;mRNA; r:62847-63998